MTTAPAEKVLRTTTEIGKSVRAYYNAVQEAKKEGKPVIWCFGLVPREIFNAVGAPVIYLEHFPILISSKQLSGKYCEVAEGIGFARDLCAFHTCFIGCAAAEERDPYVERIFAPPDIIVASNLPCMSESKSFLYLASQFNCPYFFLDVPLNTWGENVPDHAMEYCGSQLEGLFSFLSEYGYKMDEDKLKQTMALSGKAYRLWDEINTYRYAIPSPMGFADGINACFPLIQLPGTELAVELYEKLRDELKERVDNKLGVVAGEEKLRLFWFGVPPMYNLGLLNYPERYGAVLVGGSIEYTLGGGIKAEVFDPSKPVETLVKKCIMEVINPSYDAVIDFTVERVKDFKVDGVIAVNKRGCRLLPGPLRRLKDALWEQYGIPSTIFDLDGLDLRDYDDARVKANIDSFIETLLSAKGRS